jgi:hypothetical protein
VQQGDQLGGRISRPLFGNQIRWARGVLAGARENRRARQPGRNEEFRPLFGNQIRWAFKVLAERRDRRRSR